MINTFADTLPIEDHYIQILLDGNTILHRDLEITDLTNYNQIGVRPRIQVYKRNNRTVRKHKVVTEEYNKIHYNYIEAIRDFLRLKGQVS